MNLSGSKTNLRSGMLLAGFFVAAGTHSTHAQEPAPFYQNKTLTIGVGAATGGGLDTYARLIARHIGAHIPGKPSVVVANMPGAGGQIVARHMVNNAPKDGTFIATFFPSVLIDPLLNSGPRPVDPSVFGYVGNAKIEASVCMVRKDTGIKTLEELRSKTLTLGGTTTGSQVVDFPTVEKNLLGVKFNLIPGYKGTREVGAAIERGEVQGICGIGWSTLKVQYPTLLSGDMFGVMLAQEDVKGDPELNAAGVPSMYSLARNDTERQVLRVLYAQNDLGRPYATPPGLPKDRLEILQKAFVAALESQELRDDAAKMNIDVNVTTGESMKKMVDELYTSSPDVVQGLKQALGRAN
ncbi:MAG: Tripartite-type tricarboxylate transporter, receptor component TctC [Hyphomicrobiales bacterium]|nr:Tripartite-type tricarboxylate transporter, receptor component TctC [Hyphomicrobiales bacterium]